MGLKGVVNPGNPSRVEEGAETEHIGSARLTPKSIAPNPTSSCLIPVVTWFTFYQQPSTTSPHKEKNPSEMVSGDISELHDPPDVNMSVSQHCFLFWGREGGAMVLCGVSLAQNPVTSLCSLATS